MPYKVPDIQYLDKILYLDNIELNTVIVGWWRNGTNKLGNFLSERGLHYLDEPYSELNALKLDLRKELSNVPTTTQEETVARMFEKNLYKQVSISTAPVCIKLMLPHIYEPFTRQSTINRLFFYNCFSTSLVLFRKSPLDAAVSNIIAQKSGKWTYEAIANMNNTKVDIEKLPIDVSKLRNELEWMYNVWAEYIYISIAVTKNPSIWLTYEDDILPLEVVTSKPMRDKKEVVSNWDELVDIYEKESKSYFDALTIEVMKRREATKDAWLKYLEKLNKWDKEHPRTLRTIYM